MSQDVSASPNKNFFVSMLTRDIELEDAILDLLDNCLDGIVRQRGGNLDGDKPYEGYEARILMRSDRFEIQDNCGGIPRQVAVEKAFRMGRPPGDAPAMPTVGMYGIGMKRAVFKMGLSIHVSSRHAQEAWRVPISKKWLTEEDNWKLQLFDDATVLPGGAGTLIVIDELRPEVAIRFNKDVDPFINNFTNYVSQHYGIILNKGFKVFINEVPVEPKDFSILISEAIGEGTSPAIAPYYFSGKVGEVSVEIIAGLYRPIPDETELEKEAEVRASRDDAGWTVACNDRVVIYRDKSRLTGWGEANVPNYHGQFIAITGIVLLNADKTALLPLTTTKRGIDASSELYSVVKDYMRDATKHFTSFTNRWKGKERTLDELYKTSRPSGISKIREVMVSVPKATVRKESAAGSQIFTPILPVPVVTKTTKRISYEKPISEIDRLASALFERVDVEPSSIGIATFERALKELDEGRL